MDTLCGSVYVHMYFLPLKLGKIKVFYRVLVCFITSEFKYPDSSVWWIKTTTIGASLVAQWLRVRLPMQETRVRALVWEDPTCRGATRPVSHNY